MPDKKIYETIAHFENDLKRTENKFSTDVRNFEREFEANRPRYISFGGNNNLDKQLAYNLSAVEKMGQLNRRFHSDCEAMILTINSTCLPLLSLNPSVQAVGSVVDLLHKICTSLAETTTTFTMSLDGRSIGEVGSMQPEASVTARAILKYWDNYYENMPGYIEDFQQRNSEKQARIDRETEVQRKLEREYENIKSKILRVLSCCNEPINIETLMSRDSELSSYSNSKISALLMQLLRSGAIQRTARGGQAYYQIAENEYWTMS